MYNSPENRTAAKRERKGKFRHGKRSASGAIIMAQDTGRLLLGRRSPKVSETGTWAGFGGVIPRWSDARRNAVDALFKDTGFDGPVDLVPLNTYRHDESGKGFSYKNFVAIINSEFMPRMDKQHDDFRWFDMTDWPMPMHFGLEAIMADESSFDTLKTLVARAWRGDDMMAYVPDEPRTLYHCQRDHEGDDEIAPSINKYVNGRHDKFVMASHYKSKALANAFSREEGELLFNGDIKGTADEFVVICDRDWALGRDRDAHLFSFSSAGFERVMSPVGPTRKWVCAQPVSKSRAHETRAIHDPTKLMRMGLQIISLPQRAIDIDPDFTDRLSNSRSLMDDLRWMIHSGVAKWENAIAGINPNAVLAQDPNGPRPTHLNRPSKTFSSSFG